MEHGFCRAFHSSALPLPTFTNVLKHVSSHRSAQHGLMGQLPALLKIEQESAVGLDLL
jgi:hypothetical protein